MPAFLLLTVSPPVTSAENAMRVTFHAVSLSGSVSKFSICEWKNTDALRYMFAAAISARATFSLFSRSS